MPSPPAKGPLTREELLGTHVPTPVSEVLFLCLGGTGEQETAAPEITTCAFFLGPNLAASASTSSSSHWNEVLRQGSGAGIEHEVQGKLEFQIFNAKYLSFVPEIKVFKKFSLT